MNLIVKAGCRIFQKAFRLVIPVLPYREPKIVDACDDLKEVFEKEHYAGIWYKYDEFGIERLILTCEDFYDPKYIKNSSDKFGNKYGFSVKINEEKLNDNSISNISVIEEWIRYNENDNKYYYVSIYRNTKNKIIAVGIVIIIAIIAVLFLMHL